jgi:superfamily II DNA/RNA helicase
MTDFSLPPPWNEYSEKLKRRGISRPLPIQEELMPRIADMEEGALFFSAPTGSGKTFAYLLPLLSRATAASPLLILAPTIELCSQIKAEADFLLDGTEGAAGGRSLLLTGASSFERQLTGLKKKPLVIVGTPARILELVQMKKLRIDSLGFLVLDEADRLISKELLDDTAELCRRISAPVVGSSATLGAASLEKLRGLFPGRETETLNLDTISRPMLEHWFICTRHKASSLAVFLKSIGRRKALVFCSDAEYAGHCLNSVEKAHIAAGALWGGIDKRARKEALDNFREGTLRVLVTSDLAARGLDIRGLSFIVAMNV